MVLASPRSLCEVVYSKGQTLPRGFQGAFNVRFRMRRGNESGLKLGRGEKNSAVEHLTKIAGIAVGVGGFRVLIIPHWIVCEEDRCKRIVRIHLSGNFRFREGGPQSSNHLCSQC